jgi:hypothetical protein
MVPTSLKSLTAEYNTTKILVHHFGGITNSPYGSSTSACEASDLLAIALSNPLIIYHYLEALLSLELLYPHSPPRKLPTMNPDMDMQYTLEEIAIMKPIGQPLPNIASHQDWYRHTWKFVEKAPKPKREGKLSKLMEMLKPPVVSAHEKLPPAEGKYYCLAPDGRIIETTIQRAYVVSGTALAYVTGAQIAYIQYRR